MKELIPTVSPLNPTLTHFELRSLKTGNSTVKSMQNHIPISLKPNITLKLATMWYRILLCDSIGRIMFL